MLLMLLNRWLEDTCVAQLMNFVNLSIFWECRHLFKADKIFEVRSKVAKLQHFSSFVPHTSSPCQGQGARCSKTTDKKVLW